MTLGSKEEIVSKYKEAGIARMQLYTNGIGIKKQVFRQVGDGEIEFNGNVIAFIR